MAALVTEIPVDCYPNASRPGTWLCAHTAGVPSLQPESQTVTMQTSRGATEAPRNLSNYLALGCQLT